MATGIWNLPIETKRIYGMTNNFLDLPLMMGFLFYFTSSWRLSKQMKLVILFYIAFEFMVLVINGTSKSSAAIVIGPGIVVLLGYSIHFFRNELQIKLHESQEMGKILMLSSLLFSYGCFSIIYFFHYILKTPYIQDVFLIYYSVTVISSILMVIGIWIERNNILQSETDKVLAQGKKTSNLKTKEPVKEIYNDENEFKYR